MPKQPPPRQYSWSENIVFGAIGIGLLGGFFWWLYRAIKFLWESGFMLKTPFEYTEILLLAMVFISMIIAITVMTKKEDKKWRLKLTTLAKERDGESICTFARHFNCREIDTWIIRAVYEELQGEIYQYENFPIRPSDKYISELGIFEQNLVDDVYEDIAGRAERSWENCESNPYYDKVNTVEDMIYFFNHQPKIA